MQEPVHPIKHGYLNTSHYIHVAFSNLESSSLGENSVSAGSIREESQSLLCSLREIIGARAVAFRAIRPAKVASEQTPYLTRVIYCQRKQFPCGSAERLPL